MFAANGEVVVSAQFCSPRRRGSPKKEMDAKQRGREKQPLEYPSAGSMFKRPGRFLRCVIESAGLPATGIGG